MGGRIHAEAIYEAFFDDRALGALPVSMAHASDATAAVVQWRHADAAHEILAFSHYSQRFIDLYASAYVAVDPWVRAAGAAGRPDHVLRLDQYVPESVFEHSRLYQDLIVPLGADTFHCAAAMFPTPWGEGMVAVHRGRAAGPFTEDDTRALRAAMPHLRRLVEVRGELAGRRRRSRVARDALDALSLAAIAVAANRRAVQVNIAADAVLQRGDGLRLVGDRLSCDDHAARLRLEAAIAAATAKTDPVAASVSLDRQGDQKLAYLLTVTPMVGGGGQPLAQIVFRDPDASECSLQARLRARFALSRMEAAIAVEIARGLDLAAVASRRGVRASAIDRPVATLADKLGCVRKGAHLPAEIAARVADLPIAAL